MSEPERDGDRRERAGAWIPHLPPRCFHTANARAVFGEEREDENEAGGERKSERGEAAVSYWRGRGRGSVRGEGEAGF